MIRHTRCGYAMTPLVPDDVDVLVRQGEDPAEYLACLPCGLLVAAAISSTCAVPDCRDGGPTMTVHVNRQTIDVCPTHGEWMRRLGLLAVTAAESRELQATADTARLTG